MLLLSNPMLRVCVCVERGEMKMEKSQKLLQFTIQNFFFERVQLHFNVKIKIISPWNVHSPLLFALKTNMTCRSKYPPMKMDFKVENENGTRWTRRKWGKFSSVHELFSVLLWLLPLLCSVLPSLFRGNSEKFRNRMCRVNLVRYRQFSIFLTFSGGGGELLKFIGNFY
jgi:hypothetical protein